MRIGYDAKRLFNNFTGLGNYSRTLLDNLSHFYPESEYFLFTPKITKNDETARFINNPMYEIEQPQKRTPKAWWRTFSIKKALLREEIDLYHGLSHEIPHGIQHTGVKSVVTIHDLIFLHYPEQYKWIDRKIYERKFRYACEHTDKIIAISESTKIDIIEQFGIHPDKIAVVYQSCDEQFMVERSNASIQEVLQKYELPQEYLLYVGTIIERKNLLNIVKAMKELPSDLQITLVVVGGGKEYKKQVINYLQNNNLSHKVHFIRPSFEDLPALYQQAQIFLYPSIYEGFGIPVLESLYSRTPVITSNISSLPEAGGDGAYLVDPNSVDEIKTGIIQLLTNEQLRQTSIEKGLAYTQLFSGEATANAMMEVYKEVLDIKEDYFGDNS